MNDDNSIEINGLTREEARSIIPLINEMTCNMNNMFIDGDGGPRYNPTHLIMAAKLSRHFSFSFVKPLCLEKIVEIMLDGVEGTHNKLMSKFALGLFVVSNGLTTDDICDLISGNDSVLGDVDIPNTIFGEWSKKNQSVPQHLNIRRVPDCIILPFLL